MKNISIDSTSCKVHQSVNGGKKLKIRQLAYQKADEIRKYTQRWHGLGNPLACSLSPGNDHDSKHAIPLLDGIGIGGSNIPGDKAYGA